MTWDPEIDEPARRRPQVPEPSESANDGGRDLGDQPPPAHRTEAPRLAPIDPNAPVSGHLPYRDRGTTPTPSEHDWAVARTTLQPVLRPAGTAGIDVDAADVHDLAEHADRDHRQPLVDEGPQDLVVAFVLPASGFDVLVNADHLVSWGVAAREVRDAAMSNLRAWSEAAPWTREEDGGRHLLSSDTGEGQDAARVLLPETRQRIAEELAGTGRVLVGVPERHLLVAGSLRPDDGEFADLFAQFIREAHASADEPIDDRVFELIDGDLVVFAAA